MKNSFPSTSHFGSNQRLKAGKNHLRPVIKSTQFAFSLIVVFVMLISNYSQGMAISGLPQTSIFGFGAGLNENNSNLENSLLIARQNGFDWVSLDLNWTKLQPTSDKPADLSWIRNASQMANLQQISILVTIKNPPMWAMTTNGPSSEMVASLIGQIAQEIPQNVLAFEVFPGANIAANWGAPANPAAYFEMLLAAERTLMRLNSRGFIIPSIAPLQENRTESDMDDLEFLQSLYTLNNGVLPLSIIGVNYSQAILVGSPANNPQNDPIHSLRHYELVRNIMKKADHADGLIWITSFSWPLDLTDKQQQANWIFEAYKQLQGQLFIGAAFFQKMNALDNMDVNPALVSYDMNQHPALQLVHSLTVKTNADSNGTPGYQVTASDQPKGNFFEHLIAIILSWFALP